LGKNVWKFVNFSNIFAKKFSALDEEIFEIIPKYRN
jgi:hypothetical protein